MQKITVSGNNGYEIIIENSVIELTGEYVRKVTNAKKALIISDSNVMPIYGERVKNSLAKNGFEVFSFAFPAGEASKTLDTVSDMIKALCQAQLSRNDIVVALGGGVTGDMAGFASAIYLRGIDFVQIPTTLLSQVDSSVGGKTGCDLPFGKNLVGAFHNPKLVLIDPETLKTLPARYMNDGMGEIIKCGCIRSASLFEKLENCENFGDILAHAIYECVDIKRRVVENDFTEKGERMLLNFGHTLAHAIEKHYNFTGIAHGEAVGIGMLKITRASEKKGYTQKGCAERIENLLKKFGLPTTCQGDINTLCEIMLHDKKRRGNTLNLVLLKSIGDSFIESYPTKGLAAFFGEGK
jgi:3-dehydroquinate synthase